MLLYPMTLIQDVEDKFPPAESKKSSVVFILVFWKMKIYVWIIHWKFNLNKKKSFKKYILQETIKCAAPDRLHQHYACKWSRNKIKRDGERERYVVIKKRSKLIQEQHPLKITDMNRLTEQYIERNTHTQKPFFSLCSVSVCVCSCDGN